MQMRRDGRWRKDYLRRGWPEGNPDDWYEELSEYAPD